MDDHKKQMCIMIRICTFCMCSMIVVPDAVQMKTTLLIIDILNFRASIAV